MKMHSLRQHIALACLLISASEFFKRLMIHGPTFVPSYGYSRNLYHDKMGKLIQTGDGYNWERRNLTGLHTSIPSSEALDDPMSNEDSGRPNCCICEAARQSIQFDTQAR
ncbi:hypothetical protein BJ912DRAFT_689925 [Pholiota molesta]|nr:hypothetical protein BJ912DRAFT_689925 [Pholiota molesta]